MIPILFGFFFLFYFPAAQQIISMEQRPDHMFDPSAPGAEIYDGIADDLDIDSLDFRDPATITKITGMRTPPTMSPELLRAKARALSQGIWSNYDALRAILARHEATIHKRWTKKKKQQKVEILEHAWPGMPKTHRPDYALWQRSSSTTLRADAGDQAESRQKRLFMCPYINQEDLLKPRTLLLLLNARGRHPPTDFCAVDYEAMNLGCVTLKLTPIFLNTYTMILHGAQGPQEYGKLVAWSEDEDAFTWYVNRMQFMPGEGLIVLEAQNMVMDFLLALCNNILHDIPADILLTDAYPVQPEPLLKTGEETSGFNSMAIMALEAPYRVPARLDFARIAALLSAKVASAEDHIWQLRENPGYFMEHLHEIVEHRQETLKDTNGQEHHVRTSRFQNIFWTRVLGELVVNAYFELETFAELHKQAIGLQQLHSEYEPVISANRNLPEKFMTALIKFRHYINQSAKGCLGLLEQCVVASPPMRKFFVRLPSVNQTSTMISIRSRPGIKKSEDEEEVIYLLRTLWEDGRDLFLMGMPFVVDELERLLDAEPQANDLISAYIAAQIGNLSIISQCLQQLDLYQPWARGYDEALVNRKDAVQMEFAKSIAPQARLLQALDEKGKLRQAAKLCESACNFAYPLTKRRTKETTEMMVTAERNLDQLWTDIDRLVRDDAGDLASMSVTRVLSRQHPIQRTLEWVEPTPAAMSQSRSALNMTNTGIESLYKPLSTLYFGHGSDETSRTPAETSQRPKTKTRAKERQQRQCEETGATIDAISNSAAVAAAAAETKAEPIRVDARALKVFRTLFYDPAVTSTPGEVPWTDFIYALTSTGKFTAEKLYGSVWQFAKIDGESHSRIQFHEPHPRGKVPFVVARRHGRRLSRAYGWTRETFALK